MIGKNLLWTAEQHGHSVQVMLNVYAAWLKGASERDLEAIKQAMQSRPKNGLAQASPSSLRAPEAVTTLSPEESGKPVTRGKYSKNRWRRGWDSNPRAGITRPSDFESAPL
jgi:hypothetical protein